MTAAPDEAAVRAGAWESAWAHREALLRVARRRSVSAADAEDAVSEAIVRSYEDGSVEQDRMAPWLTTVTTRLCVDAARDRARAPKRAAYQLRQGSREPSHDEQVCDRAEAAWMAGHVAALPERQSRALELRAEGLDVADIASLMQISEKAVEGLLHRARTQLRAVLSRAVGWIGLVLATLVAAARRRGTAGAAAVTAVGVTALLGAHVVVPPPAAVLPAEVAGTSRPAAPADVAPAGRVARPPAAAPVDVPPAAPEGARPPAVAQERPAPPPRAQDPVELPAPTVRAPALEAGSIAVGSAGTSHHERDKTLLESATECVEHGPVVSPTAVGCPPRG